MSLCLYVCLSLNHTSTYARYIRQLVVDMKMIKICRPHCSMQAILQYVGHIAICRPYCNMQATLQYVGHIAICRPHCNVPYACQRLCVVQTAGRVTFVYISTCRTSGCVVQTASRATFSCTFQRAVVHNG